jgi:hypothetical protein
MELSCEWPIASFLEEAILSASSSEPLTSLATPHTTKRGAANDDYQICCTHAYCRSSFWSQPMCDDGEPATSPRSSRLSH